MTLARDCPTIPKNMHGGTKNAIDRVSCKTLNEKSISYGEIMLQESFKTYLFSLRDILSNILSNQRVLHRRRKTPNR